MTQTLFYINNSPVNPPQNWKGLSVELNYSKDQFPQGGTVSITDMEWVRENYDLLINYINAGQNNTGVGITEAPPLRIDLTNGVQTKTVFVGYMDFTNCKIKDKIKITTKAVSHATVDWINQVANTFTFEYLASADFAATGLPGAIDPSYYRWMPYINSLVPNYEQSAMCSLMVFSVVDSMNKVLTRLSELVIDTANPFTTANAILQAIIQVAYLIVLIATLIKLIEDIIKFIISPVKYHAGMYVRDLMERAVTYLSQGKMTFVSTIWAPGSDYYNEFIIPEKLFNAISKTDSSLFGFLVPDKNEQVGWYKGTFGKLLEAMKKKYNAKIVVQANADGTGTVTFLRKDLNATAPTYQLPDIYQPEYTYNMDELPANYLISYQIDATDMNTEQNYAGTIFQVICAQKTVNYQPFVMIKHFEEIDIPFARAARKTTLTNPEIIIKDFLEVFQTIDNALVTVVNAVINAVNAIIGFLNKIIKALKFIGIKVNWQISTIPTLAKVDLTSAITNREGMMLLSADHFNIPKVLILQEGSASQFNKIDPANDTVQTAQAMWNNYHYVNSFIPEQLNSAYADRPTGNQYQRKSFIVPFTWDNFNAVFANNQIQDNKGNPALIESLKFYPPSPDESGKAEMTVRFPMIFTLNLKETYLNPTGA